MIKFPRTASEFAEHGREVLVICDDCGRARRVPADVLVLEFGADFDLYDGYTELVLQLRCDACGKARRLIDFRNPGAKHFEAFSFEESVVASLEASALARARGR